MTKIIQDLFLTELNSSNVSNAPFIINAVGTYQLLKLLVKIVIAKYDL